MRGQFRSMKGAVFLSLIDQAFLSAMSLVISLVLVKFSTPLSVGIYAVAMAMMFFAVGIQSALVTTPAAVRIFGIAPEAQVEVLSTLTSIDLLLNIFLTCACLLGTLAMGFTPMQSIVTTLFLASSMIRELARGLLIGVGDIAKCLTLDLVYLLISSVCIALLWKYVAPEIACLLGLSIGNLLSLMRLCPPFHRQPRQMMQHLAKYQPYWKESRWMLVGATATDLQERSYVFVLQFLRGTAVVGTIHAGRFLVAPLGLLTTAWGRAMRPRMAALLSEGKRNEARKIVRTGFLAMSVLTLIYIAVLLAFWNFIDQQLFAGRYENMFPVVLAWCGYGLLNAPANCLSFYFQAERRFRPLAVNAVVGGLVSLLCLASLILPVPNYIAICCLYVGIAIALAGQLKWWFAEPEQQGQPT